MALQVGELFATLNLATGDFEGALTKSQALVKKTGILMADFAVKTVKSVSSVGKGFEGAMAKVQAVSGATGEELDSLKNTAREWGAKTQYTAMEAADALYYMSLAGWEAETSAASIGPVLSLAAAGAMELGKASDIITDYVTAFNMVNTTNPDGLNRYGDAAMSLAEKTSTCATSLSNLMAYAQSHANTNIEQLGQAYKNAASNMASMGQTAESTTAMIMALSNAGLKGARAGTAVQMIMKDMQSKMGKNGAKEGFILIGDKQVQVMDTVTGDFIEVTKVLGDIEAATAGMGTAAKSLALSKTFNKKSISGLNSILLQGTDTVSRFKAELEGVSLNAATTAEDQMGTMTNTMTGDLKILASAWQEVELSIYDSFNSAGKGLGVLRKSVQGATKVVQKFGVAWNRGFDTDSIMDIMSAVHELASGIGEELLNAAINGANALAEAAPNLAAGMYVTLTKAFAMLRAKVPGIFQNLVNGLPAMFQVLGSLAGELFSTLNSLVGSAFASLIAALPSLAPALLQGLLNLFETAFVGVISALGGLVAGLRAGFAAAMQGGSFEEAFMEAFNINSKTVEDRMREKLGLNKDLDVGNEEEQQVQTAAEKERAIWDEYEAEKKRISDELAEGKILDPADAVRQQAAAVDKRTKALEALQAQTNPTEENHDSTTAMGQAYDLYEMLTNKKGADDKEANEAFKTYLGERKATNEEKLDAYMEYVKNSGASEDEIAKAQEEVRKIREANAGAEETMTTLADDSSWNVGKTNEGATTEAVEEKKRQFEVASSQLDEISAQADELYRRIGELDEGAAESAEGGEPAKTDICELLGIGEISWESLYNNFETAKEEIKSRLTQIFQSLPATLETALREATLTVSNIIGLLFGTKEVVIDDNGISQIVDVEVPEGEDNPLAQAISNCLVSGLKGISEGLPELISTLGTVVTNIINGLGDALDEFIRDGSDSLATDGSGGIGGIVDSFVEAFKKVFTAASNKGGEIASDIATFLATAFSKIKWDEAGSNLATIAISILTAIKTALIGDINKEAGEEGGDSEGLAGAAKGLASGIVTALANALTEGNITTALGEIKEIGSGLFKILSEALTGDVSDTNVDDGNGGIVSVGLQIVQNIASALAKAFTPDNIEAAISNTGTLVTGLFTLIKDALIGKTVENADGTVDESKGLLAYGKDIILSIGQSIAKVLSDPNAIKGAMSGLGDIASGLFDIIGQILTGETTTDADGKTVKTDGLLDYGERILINIGTALASAFSDTNIENAVAGMGDLAKKLFDVIGRVLTGGTTTDSSGNTIKTDGLLNNGLEILKGIGTALAGVFTEDNIKNALGTFKDIAGKIFGVIGQALVGGETVHGSSSFVYATKDGGFADSALDIVKSIVGGIADTLTEGNITEALKSVADFGKKLYSIISQALLGDGTGGEGENTGLLDKGVEIAQNIINALGTAITDALQPGNIDTVLDGIESFGESLAPLIGTALYKGLEVVGTLTEWLNASPIIDGVEDSTTTNAQRIVSGVLNFIKSAFENPETGTLDLSGLGEIIGNAIVAALNGLSTAVEWIADNKNEVINAFKEMFDSIGETLESEGYDFSDVIGGVITATLTAKALSSMFTKALGGLGAGKLLIGALFADVLTNNFIGDYLNTDVWMTDLTGKLVKSSKGAELGKKIMSFLSDAIGDVKAADVAKNVESLIDGIFALIEGLFSDPSAAQNIGEAAGGAAVGIVNGLVNAMKNPALWDGLGSFVLGLLEGMIGGILDSFNLEYAYTSGGGNETWKANHPWSTEDVGKYVEESGVAKQSGVGLETVDVMKINVDSIIAENPELTKEKIDEMLQGLCEDGTVSPDIQTLVDGGNVEYLIEWNDTNASNFKEAIDTLIAEATEEYNEGGGGGVDGVVIEKGVTLHLENKGDGTEFEGTDTSGAQEWLSDKNGNGTGRNRPHIGVESSAITSLEDAESTLATLSTMPPDSTVWQQYADDLGMSVEELKGFAAQYAAEIELANAEVAEAGAPATEGYLTEAENVDPTGAADTVVGKFRDAIDAAQATGSPAKYFYEPGGYAAQGYGEGAAEEDMTSYGAAIVDNLMKAIVAARDKLKETLSTLFTSTPVPTPETQPTQPTTQPQATTQTVDVTTNVNTAGVNIDTGALTSQITSSAHLLGMYFCTGFAQGITSNTGFIKTAASNAVKAAIAAAETTAGISSPSKVMAKDGMWFDEGFALGISRNANTGVSAASSMVQQAVNAATIKRPTGGISGLYSAYQSNAQAQAIDYDQMAAAMAQVNLTTNLNGKRVSQSMERDTAVTQNSRARRIAVRYGGR